MFVSQLWVYPIKACQGIKMKSAKLGPCGIELDRAWCVVDRDGTRYRQNEQLSQRKLPCLASLCIEMPEGSKNLHISAPGMPPMKVPIAESAYEKNELITIECGAKSTTSSGSWQLGTMDSRCGDDEINAWLTKYLNEADGNKKKKPTTRYALVRSMSNTVRYMCRYCGPDQVPFSEDVAKQRTLEGSPFKMQTVDIHPEDKVRFSDFSAFLLTSERSLANLASTMGLESYPMESFRPNIVVDGGDLPWAEEDWRVFTVGSTSFRKLKNTPRCTVPARNQKTGGWVHDADKLLCQKTLRKMFPKKCIDDEWGQEWEGPMFGIHVGSAGVQAEIQVGDPIAVQKRKPSMPLFAIVVAIAFVLFCYACYTLRL
jgi:uncharacterized protein YcbX